ncbi:MAG: molybdopterin-dependent oxidoreductase [Proteobacteria bacterium]|nr:molybdopterin-dependent oxidoreductase [Pseudomonadota bacterium]NIS72052.1 molybdopterin-dependent oxidoreductase [Pseudomonadota bacterium]
MKRTEEALVTTCCNGCYFECGLVVHVKKGKVVKITGDRKNPMNRGYICIRGVKYKDLLYHKDRLRFPLKRARGRKGERTQWERVSWEEALDSISDRLQEIKEEHGALSLAVAIDGRPQHWQTVLFGRSLGTPNVWACTDLCEGPAIVADHVTVGQLITQMVEPEYEKSKLILLWGANPEVTHGPYWRNIMDAQKGGAKVIAIDPRFTKVAKKADIWVRINPATDGALALGMLYVIINEGLYDREFVAKWTVGFDRLKDRVQEYPVDEVSRITGVPEPEIMHIARMFATIKPACLYSRTGVTQKNNATQTARAQTILAAITGNLDVPGGQPLGNRCPGLVLRGDFIYNPQYRLAPEIEDQRIGAKRYPLAARYIYVCHNQSVVHSILHGDPYRIRGVFLTGTNPVMSNANTRKTWEALKRLDFLVVTDYFMTPTAELADFVLPAATWVERDDIGTEYNQKCMGVRQKAIQPVGDCWEDMKIVFELAKVMKRKGYLREEDTFIPWETVEELNDFRLKDTGMTFQEFKKKGIVYFEPEYKKYELDGFRTPSGKVELHSTLFEEFGYDPLPNFQYPLESEANTPELAKRYPITLLTGVKTRVFWHSDGRQLDWARKILSQPEIEMHPDDAAERGIQDGDWVWVESTRASRVKLKARISADVPKGVASAQHAWWFPEKPAPEHGCFDSNINVITIDIPCDPISGTPTYKGLLCEIARVDE